MIEKQLKFAVLIQLPDDIYYSQDNFKVHS